MNADVGGNCEDTKPGEIITTNNGVSLLIHLIFRHYCKYCSMLYSNNLTTFITSLVNDGKVVACQTMISYLVLPKILIFTSMEWAGIDLHEWKNA